MKWQDQLIRNKSFKVLPQNDLEVEETQVEEIEKEVVEDQKEVEESKLEFYEERSRRKARRNPEVKRMLNRTKIRLERRRKKCKNEKTHKQDHF